MDILKHTVYLLLLTLCMAACRSCDDVACDDPGDKACPNYDPCWGKERVSAAFDVYGNLAPGISNRDSLMKQGDTLIADRNYTFIADDDTAERYSWRIGTDPRVFTGRSVSLGFECDVVGTSITITLVTERLSDSTCFAQAVRRDTNSRVIHFVPSWETLTVGSFIGYTDEAPGIPHEIEIALFCDENNGCRCLNDFVDVARITNLDRSGCTQTLQIHNGLLYKSAAYSTLRPAIASEGCYVPHGYANTQGSFVDVFVSPDGDSIEIRYLRTLVNLPEYEVRRMIFRGVRVY